MRKTWKKLLAVLLALSMVLSLSVTGWAAETTGGTKLELEDLDPAKLNVPAVGQVEEEETTDAPAYEADDVVRVSIFLNRPATIDAGYSTQNIAANTGAMAYRQALRNQQSQMTAAIERKLGSKLDVKWNLTLVANAISANVRFGDIAAIEAIPGVRSVVIEKRYEMDKGVDADRPDTAVTTEYMVGATAAWAAGFTGAGSRIAIIDTGLDTTHQSFDAEAFDHAVAEDAEKAGKTVADYNLLTADEISSLSGQLNGKGVFLTNKIAYGYNYVDRNTTVDHMSDTQGEHGSHVAGIATANRYVKVDGEFVDAVTEVGAVGVAPDAQIMVMKVFGAGGGAYDSDYMVAIEDAIVLNADSVNLSLGSGAPGWTFSGQYEDIMNGLVENHTVVTISAGNSGSWSDSLEGENAIGYIYSQDISLHTGGSPGSFTNSLCVASADNIGVTGAPLVFNESQTVFFTETSGYGNEPMASIPGVYDYVYLNSFGTDEEWDAVGEFVAGKVALCNRGSTSFYEKANAAVRNGAVAVIIVNNQDGVINMNLTGYEYTAPAVSITKAEGATIRSNSTTETVGETTVYTGKVEVTSTLQTGVTMDRSEATISSFSSWGVPGSLIMKPEITAPGGSIYSVFGTNKTNSGVTGGSDQYEVMSGTSMAAPQMAGMAAVMGQYVRENGLEEWTDGNARTLINSLLMSTATPMIEADSGSYYSVLRQGAGLADVYAATQAKSFITMNEDATASFADGKVKVELGDNPERNPIYTYSFNLTNMSEQDLSYELNTDMFTQDVFEYDGWSYMDTWTVKLPAEVTYVWDDFEFEEHDVDKNGITNAADADAILKCMIGEVAEEDLDLAAGDMDGDGKFSTYDAHLLLALLAEELEERGDLVVPAGETVTVEVTIQLTDTAMLDDEIRNGAYVEGYTFVTCADSTDEGEALDVEHSIPILGFYGSWTDASMFDHNTAIEAAYGDLEAYIPDNQGKAGLQIKYADGKSAMFMGNPYLVEDEFPADRLAISSKTTLTAFKYGLIRNAGTADFLITDANDEVLYSGGVANEVYGAWYYVNGSAWQDTSLQNQRIGRMVSDLGVAEGDQFTAAMYAIPEYNAMQINDGASGSATEAELLDIIKSGVLGEGASLGYTFTVDDKAPEVISAVLSEDGKTITVTAKDDNYIAYLGLMDVNGQVSYAGGVPEQSAKGETVEATFQLDAETMGNAVALFVGDYAKNETASLVRLADGPVIVKLPVYLLTDTLVDGEEYLIAEVNEAGKANILNSNGQNYYTGVAAATVVTDERGTYIPADGVADSSVWVATAGDGAFTFANKDDNGALGFNNVDSPYVSWANPGYADDFIYQDDMLLYAAYAAYGYGMYYEGGSFMFGAAAPVYLYQKVVLEEEIDPDNASAVLVSPHAVTLILGVQETVALSASVQPIVLSDKSVTWTSSDESVATVDAEGVVTAVAEGTAVITAASNATPDVTDSCVVSVTTKTPLEASINGQVAFGKDRIEFAAIDLNDMSTTNLAEDESNNPFSAFVGGGRSGDYLYGCDIDGDFHRYNATEDFAYDSDYHWVINKTYMPMDIASMPHFAGYDADGEVVDTYEYDFIAPTANGWLAMFYDGSNASYFDLSSLANFVALCFAGIDDYDENGNISYYYYAMDDQGILYLFMIYPDLEKGGLSLDYMEIGPVTVLSMGEDPTAYSLGYAGATGLPEGVFIADNNSQSIYYVELTELKQEYEAVYVGKVAGASNLSALFDDLFDTVSSLMEEEKAPGAASLFKADGTVRMSAESVNVAGEKRSSVVVGGLNAVTNVAPAPDRPEFAFTRPYDDEGNYYEALVMDDATNGLYELTYDAENTKFLDYAAFDKNDEELQHFFLTDDGEGTIRFDFAAAEEESPYIMLLFAAGCEDAEMQLVTSELGDDLDAGITDDMVVPGLGHDWGEPTWDWSDDLTSATATFVCQRNEEHVKVVEAEITVEETEDGYVITATVTGPDGETYTEVRTTTGYQIIVEDYTNGKATTSVEEGKRYLPGQVLFTVDCDEVCLVAQKNEDGTYTVLPCTEAESTHIFTVNIVDADVTVVIALKGDANLDGTVSAKDATLVKQVYLGTAAFETDEALQNLTGDAFPDGKISTKDATVIKQVALGTRTLEW
jgi:lactocepin